MQRLPPKPPRTTAKKSHARPEYAVIGQTLRAFRVEAGFTQVDLAERLGRSQNYVSQAETGQKRLDGLQLRDWSQVCGHDLAAFGARVDARLGIADEEDGSGAR